MKRFLIALQFLTIFPVKIKSEIKDRDFGASLLYFPLVGLLIGLLLAGSVFLFSFLPVLFKSTLILILSIIITGGIHLDGFADTCDGLYGLRPKEKILEIMRDSRIGVMAVVGLVTLLLLKFSLIASLRNEVLWKALIVMAVFSRWTQGLACSNSAYARKEGKAKYFIEYASKRDVFIGGLFSLALFVLLMQIKGTILFLVSAPVIFLFLQYIKKKIGGMTGDTIGAISEVAEVLILLFFSIIINIWCL
jgi:adenosylcobinamide-GDP ribazoletransferase